MPASVRYSRIVISFGRSLLGISKAYLEELGASTEHPGLAPEWRLLVMTGFLGGLTTFSTFSAEVTHLIQQGRMLWACAAIGAHLFGSLAMTAAGLGTVALLRRV